MAQISPQLNIPSSAGINDILKNLPAPISDLINNAKNISNSFNSGASNAPIQIPTNINQISQLNITSWLQNGSFSGIYSAAIKILQLAGNLALWILGIVTDLIKQGLSLIH